MLNNLIEFLITCKDKTDITYQLRKNIQKKKRTIVIVPDDKETEEYINEYEYRFIELGIKLDYVLFCSLKHFINEEDKFKDYEILVDKRTYISILEKQLTLINTMKTLLQ